MPTSTVTIYHNPKCGTSRTVLERIRHAGVEPRVIEYLVTPPDRQTLHTLIRDAGLSVRAAMRDKGAPFQELGLDDAGLSDDQLLDAMMEHPILINRPFVVAPGGTRLCRPADVILEILPQAEALETPA